MSNLTWLFIAFAVVWAALGLYLYSLAARQRNLEKRLEQLGKYARPGSSEDDEVPAQRHNL